MAPVAIVVAMLLGLFGLAPGVASAMGGPQGVVRAVTCTGLGTVSVSLPGGIAVGPLPAGVQMYVGYRATDDRTGATVSGGAAPGPLSCGAVPFTDLHPAEVVAGPRPPGVAAGDDLTGAWLVSVTVELPPSTAPEPRSVAVGPATLAGAVQSYLSTRSGSASVGVYDATSGSTYVVPSSETFVTASIVKVDILATLMRDAEVAGRGLTASEQATATQMIEFSDNDSATELWNEVGGSSGVGSFNNLIGMPSTVAGPGGFWGLTTTTPADQLALMRVVAYPNAILGDAQRAYIEDLMEHVTSSQDWGVSGGVPSGVTVALKNGWLPVDSGWEINSIGHVAGSGRDYVISVLTVGDPSMPYGISTVQGVSSLVWQALAASTSQPAVAVNSNGTMQVFAVASGRIVTSWQTGPGQAFGGWLDLDFPAQAVGVPGVGTNASGALQLFVRTDDNRLLTSWQSAPSSAWGGWADLGADGQIGSDPTVGANSNKTVQVFVEGTGGRVLTSWQTGPNQGFGGWLDMGVAAPAAGAPAVGVNASGALQVFVRTTSNRLLTSWQSGPSAPWGGWADLGADGQIGSGPAVAVNSNKTVQVFVEGTGGRVLTSWQTGPNQGFGGWLDMGVAAPAAGAPAVGVNASGALQVFVRTTSNRLLTSWQSGPSAPWGGWADLGADGQIISDPTVGANSDQTIQIFVRGPGSGLISAAQTGPDEGFGTWLNLNVPV